MLGGRSHLQQVFAIDAIHHAVRARRHTFVSATHDRLEIVRIEKVDRVNTIVGHQEAKVLNVMRSKSMGNVIDRIRGECISGGHGFGVENVLLKIRY